MPRTNSREPRLFRRARGRLVFFACGSLVLLGAAVASAQFNARVAGLVTDRDGTPIEGVTIFIIQIEQDPSRPTPDIELATAADGRYYQRNVRLGRVRIIFQKEGYDEIVMEREMRAGPNRIDVTLLPFTVPEAMARAEAAAESYGAGYEAFQAGRYADAVAAMRDVLESLEPTEQNREALIAVYQLLGRSHMELEQYPEAAAAYEKWVGLDPEESTAHVELARAYGEAGEKEKAAAEFGEAQALEPEDAISYYNAGALMIDAGQIEDGIASIERALELQDHYPLAHKTVAFAYARVAEYAKAIEHFKKYLEQEPEAPDREQIAQFIAALEQEIGG